MSLAELITTGKILTPPRIVLYGGQGIGKSTFASQLPSPIFLLTETGVDNIDTNKLPMCKTWNDILYQLTQIEHEEHKFKSLVIDTVSGIEKIIEKKVCEENKNATSVASIPFGKGYGETTAYFNQFLEMLENIRQTKKMIIVLVGHEKLEPVKTPDTAEYDRYNIDLDKRVVPDLNRWADAIFFVRHKVFTKEVSDNFGKKVHQAVTSGRVLLTEETAAYVAKNRYGLPTEFPFEKTGTTNLVLKTIKACFDGTSPKEEKKEVKEEETNKEEEKKEVKKEEVVEETKKARGRPSKEEKLKAVMEEEDDLPSLSGDEDDGRDSAGR